MPSTILKESSIGKCISNSWSSTLLKFNQDKYLATPSFFNKQLLYKQQGFNNLQIKQSEGFKIWN